MAAFTQQEDRLLPIVSRSLAVTFNKIQRTVVLVIVVISNGFNDDAKSRSDR